MNKINMNHYVLFHAYGSNEILAECRFALMQLLQQHDVETICVVLYTDNPLYFKNELEAFSNAITEHITAKQITAWRGEINFVHRVKIKVLQHFFSKYNGSVLYCDTDTYCIQSPATLFANIDNGAFYMHTNEGYIKPTGNLVIKKWHHFLANNNIQINNKKVANIESISMWNAGVIGIGSQYASLLAEVLAITDSIYPLLPRHTVEQFAFSYVFQNTCTILPADNFIFHYWYLKEYRIFLKNFYLKYGTMSIDWQARKILGYLAEPILKEKMLYNKRFFLKRLFTPKWDIADYSKNV